MLGSCPTWAKRPTRVTATPWQQKKEDDGRRKKLTAEERACGGRGVDCTYILSTNLSLSTSAVTWIARVRISS